MKDIKEKRRRLDVGTEITTYSHIVYGANSLEVEAGTTGLMGGDSGHGGRTYFSVKDAGATDIEVRNFSGGFEVTLGGDSELETIIRALRFITNVLDEMIQNHED